MKHWNGENLKELIRRSNSKIFVLSKYLGVSAYKIEKYCKNEQEPNLETMIKIADYFGVPMDFLLCRCTAEETELILFN